MCLTGRGRRPVVEQSNGLPAAVAEAELEEGKGDSTCTSSDTAHSSSYVEGECASSHSPIDMGSSSEALAGDMRSAIQATPAHTDSITPAVQPQQMRTPAAAASGQSAPGMLAAPDQDAGHLCTAPSQPSSAVPGRPCGGVPVAAVSSSHNTLERVSACGAAGTVASAAVSGRGRPRDQDARRKLALQARLAALLRVEAQRGLRTSTRHPGEGGVPPPTLIYSIFSFYSFWCSSSDLFVDLVPLSRSALLRPPLLLFCFLMYHACCLHVTAPHISVLIFTYFSFCFLACQIPLTMAPALTKRHPAGCMQRTCAGGYCRCVAHVALARNMS